MKFGFFFVKFSDCKLCICDILCTRGNSITRLIHRQLRRDDKIMGIDKTNETTAKTPKFSKLLLPSRQTKTTNSTSVAIPPPVCLSRSKFLVEYYAWYVSVARYVDFRARMRPKHCHVAFICIVFCLSRLRAFD